MFNKLFPSFGVKNVQLYYLLGIFLNGWFILPNWVFYFRQHITTTQIGLVEGVAVLVGILVEVPTGVIADTLGKKRSLIVGSLFQILSCLVLINSTTFLHFLIGNILMFIGFSFHSGASEAFGYDSLKEKGREAHYDHVVGRYNSLSIAATLISTFIGGFLFSLNPTFPFYAWVIFLSMSLVVLSKTTEPKFDSKKFVIKEYLIHLKEGVLTLFGSQLHNYIIPLLSLPIIIKLYQGLVRQSMAGYFGFSGETFGYLFALVSVPAILFSFRYDQIRKYLGNKHFLILVLAGYSFIFGIAKTGSGLLVGGTIYLFINIFENLSRPLVSSIINERIDSKHRATTLSTLALITQIPYIFLVVFFANLTEEKNITILFSIYSIIMFATLIYSYLFIKKE